MCAALLAHRGLRVLVLEKNPAVGGILASRTREGFKLDAGSHLVSRGAKGPLGEALRAVGLDRPRFLRHRIPVRSRGIFEIAAPARRLGLPRVALEAIRRLRIPRREAIGLTRMMVRVFTIREADLTAWDRRTLEEFILRYTEHPGTYFLFSFLASIFFVLPPWEVSAGEAVRSLRAVLRDYSLSYVEGGMDQIPLALLGRVRAAGGETVVNSRVIAIRRRGEDLAVATTSGDEFEAPTVVCNLAPADALALLDGIDIPEDYAARVRSLRGSGNAHQLKIALRRPLVDEGCLIGGLSTSGLRVENLTHDLLRRTVAGIAQGRVMDPLAVYAPVPTNFDPTLAPSGRQILLVSVFGAVADSPLDPPERWREATLAALAGILPGLEEETLFVEFSPIPTVAAWMGKGNRGAISTGQIPGQVGSDRLPVETPVPGLYLCGDGAGGRGIGTELAADSGMEAARAVLG